MPCSLLAELHAEQGFAPRELALDGVDRDAADTRQLSVGKTVHVAQSQQDAGFPRDALEGSVEIEVGGGRAMVRRTQGRPPRVRALAVRRPRGMPPELVHADVGKDAVEPRGDGPSRVVAR